MTPVYSLHDTDTGCVLYTAKTRAQAQLLHESALDAGLDLLVLDPSGRPAVLDPAAGRPACTPEELATYCAWRAQLEDAHG